MSASGSDPQSTAFNLLAEPIRRWIWRKGWTALRDIQERAIPQLIDGDEDVIVAAATAGGKTEAAFLPLISRAYATCEAEGFDLVYVGPLRALINDQFRRLEDLCEALEMPVHPWHGDITQGVKARARKDPRGILLITPESLEAMFVLRGAEIARLFAGTQAIVIDELHALLDSERGIHLRSLLTRLELSVGRRVRRVGLSATLGDMELVNTYLRPEAPDQIVQLISRSDGQELQVQLRGYVDHGHDNLTDSGEARPDGTDASDISAFRAVGEHLFDRLRGTNNLVFAGSRQNVEIYSDTLRRLCEARKLPNEFFPHHASLSREHREFVENRLKDGKFPVTAICTSTLELGIDIGDVTCVGQIGAPWSVAALRQRLGRSGRRDGQPAVLRMYAIEPETNENSHPVDRLHLGLVRSVAMIQLLIEGWCEPPRIEALHLSTLTHQVLSVIVERGGASASRLYATLCNRGPFRSVDQSLFARLLRRLGEPEVALLEQAADGTLLLGQEGERLAEHYSFYSVFHTPQEYRVVHDSKTLGTIPLFAPLAKDMTIILVGRRWCVAEIHDTDKVVQVTPDHSGRPPVFGGDPGDIHQKVIERMREVLRDDILPAYLDKTAAEILSASRREYWRSGLDEQPIQRLGEDRYLLTPWTGTVGTASLAMVLTALDYRVGTFDGILEVVSNRASSKDLFLQLEEIAAGKLNLRELIQKRAVVPLSEKFHRYLNKDLLLADALSSSLDLDSVPHIARSLCQQR
ncbi:MAG: DEAD/DEAH box helicase [Gammaproteobacteria bacterium]|nr:DEAD/DEAH box helicase [Gammaproteobacteria bacterium]MDE0281764.1 DEAD/DEAH box helicase [Gammaproteobacteria bacterium]